MKTNFKWPITSLDFDKILSESQSQAGQDLFVIAVTQGKKNGRWLELGCGHPKKGSNTWLLEKEFSWTGESVTISPKQQAWIVFYQNVRSCFGSDIPSDWIPNPKDIHDLPTHVQKELIEIHDYDLYVGGHDTSINAKNFDDIQTAWQTLRPGAKLIIADARTLDFTSLEGSYDYLQIDIDDHVNHCDLLKSVIEEHEFDVITFEHDFWRKTADTAFCRDQSRQILQGSGYVLLCTDITCEPHQGFGIDNEHIYFEDWYVHPSRVDEKIIDTYRCVADHPRPLYYTDVLFDVEVLTD